MQSLDDLDTLLLVDLLRDRSPARKSLGQHYLIDDDVIDQTLQLTDEYESPLGPKSHVLEIGPGPGSLTLALLRSGAKVSALEVDRESVSHLERVFGRMDCEVDIQEVDAVSASWPPGITHVISNLPYQISSPILERIRTQHAKKALKLVILLVQEEFADRMAMSSLPYDIGPLGLNLWLDFEVVLSRKVPPSSFIPSPRVHSRLTVLKPSNRPQTEGLDRTLFRIVTKHCFSHRRRKLSTLLSKSPLRISRANGWHKQRWDTAISELFDSGVEGLTEDWADMRPEGLEPLDWVSLVRYISSK
ncbi:MAG: rRNA adenine N-6-methyltransferase family protein [Candidatus Thermoplasmatota archaeon]|nr:rRNA adenine N-6-methyltransferase family protein [Candidatus Thermoplasmatota archaeon]